MNDDDKRRTGEYSAGTPSLDDFAAALRLRPRPDWVNEVRRDQANRWRAGNCISVEDYLHRCPELTGSEEDVLVLIVGEILLRRKLGQVPLLDEYQQRFPHVASQISIQFQLDGLWTGAGAGTIAVERMSCPACRHELDAPDDGLSIVEICPSCGFDTRSEPQAALHWHDNGEARKLGRYELVEQVGVGAFGVVYKARDLELGRLVAIKVPRATHLAAGDDGRRFLREAKSVAQLRHPSIVSVHEIGQLGQTPYLVSEFVEGTTLAEVLSSGRLALQEAAELVATLADALHYAHEMGVVHRDVKPANIMLDQKGLPRLMDFGLARLETGEVSMTIDGQVLGTPAYMSPEQARGESRQVDGRTDVYSLGVILYQLLTGELPFRGTTRMVLHQALHDEPPRPRSINHLVPRDLETICLRAMAKEARGRYASARDMADDVRRFRQGEPIHARAIGGAERAWRWCRRKPALAGMTAIVGTLLVAIGVGGAMAAVQYRRQAQKEQLLRSEADDNLYFQQIALAHRELTSPIPSPGKAQDLLDACPRKHRGWEWSYLSRLWWGEQLILRDPQNADFCGLAFSPEGNRIAAACLDNTIKVWDLVTGELVTLVGHENRVVSVAFHPQDGNRLASASADTTVRVWDLSTGEEVLRCVGDQYAPYGAAHAVTFSPNGQWLAAACEGGVVRVWQAVTGDTIYALGGHEKRASCVAFSPDGQQVATGSWRGTIFLWDAKTGRAIHTLRAGHIHPAASVAFSPDGRRLAVGNFDRLIDIWDTSSGKRLRTLTGHSGLVLGLVFSKDGRRIASASEDRTVRIWDPITGREVLQLRGHSEPCQGLALSPDGLRLASSSRDGTVRFWDATRIPKTKRHQLREFNEHAHEIWAVDVSPDGKRVAAAGLDPTIRVWDAMTGQLIRTITTFTDVVFDLDFSPDGRQLAAVGIDNGRPPFVALAWDLETGELLFPPFRKPSEIFAVEFRPGGTHLAIGWSKSGVELVNVGTGRATPLALSSNEDTDLRLQGVVFSPDGRRLASLDSDGILSAWDITRDPVPASEMRFTLRSSSDPIFSMAYSADGSRLVTGGVDGEMTLWDADLGQSMSTSRGHFEGEVWSVTFTPNDRWIVAAGASCTAQIWDAATLEPRRAIRGHVGPIRSLAMSSDGSLLATGSSDKSVKLWDLAKISGAAP